MNNAEEVNNAEKEVPLHVLKTPTDENDNSFNKAVNLVFKLRLENSRIGNFVFN